MSKKLLDEVAQHRKEIKYEFVTFSLWELVHMFREKEIRIQPDFQRLFRWSRLQQSQFVESLILEIPIPPFFFFETSDGTWELLDGLQRLSSIIKFCSHKEDVPETYQGEDFNDHEWHYETQNNIDFPLQLLPTDYLVALGGLSFVRLPIQLQLNFKRSRLQVVVLKRETFESYKYEVFKRLNTSGATLQAQEVRNCAVRLLDNEFPKFLNEIASYEAFLNSLKIDSVKIRARYGEELALRFFTMKNYGSHFKHDVEQFLTKYMESVASKKLAFDYEKEAAIFKRTWDVIHGSVEPGHAFRFKDGSGNSRGVFSPTLFELVSLHVAWHLEEMSNLPKEVVSDRIKKLIVKAKENQLTGAGSNSEKKTRGRLTLAREGLSMSHQAELHRVADEFLDTTSQTYSECSRGIAILDRIIVGVPSSLTGSARLSLLPSLYAYWERFFRIVFSEFVRSIGSTTIPMKDFCDSVARYRLKKELATSMKALDVKQLSDLAQRISISEFQNYISRVHAMIEEPLNFPNAADYVETHSNVNFLVLKENCERLGLNVEDIKDGFSGTPHNCFPSLNALVRTRNSIAHGENIATLGESDWQNHREFVLTLMHVVQYTLYTSIQDTSKMLKIP